MRRTPSQPGPDAEARILILIDAFTQGDDALEGRTKLAKLDFLLRYPAYLQRALAIRAPRATILVDSVEANNIDHRMIRYRYGPWDPAYFSLLGRLVGKGLVKSVSLPRGVGYQVTSLGHDVAVRITSNVEWSQTAESARLLKRFFDLTGTWLKNFVYQHFPEVSQAKWGDRL
jgi:hypothetical protein